MNQDDIDTLERIAQTSYVILRLIEYCADEGIRFEQLEQKTVIKITSAAAMAFCHSKSTGDILIEALKRAFTDANT